MSRLVVVGSSNTDMVIRVPHLPAPGETVLGGSFSTAGGGKGANQAVAAARADGDVSLVACVGKDDFGYAALAAFAVVGINTDHCMVDPQAPSGVAQILVDPSGENSIAVAPGANACLLPRHIDTAGRLLEKAAVVLLQLETPIETVLAAARRANQADAVVILNPAPAQLLPAELYPLLQMLTPNETEAALLTGIQVRDPGSAAAAADTLHQRGVGTVLITRGANGVYLSQSDDSREPLRSEHPGFPVTAVDTTAAGDVFNGCLAVALTEGLPLPQAIRFAQAAAALSVQQPGAQASAPTRAAIESFLITQATTDTQTP
ncbi:ribokinase [Haliea sp. E1-2-M8]|uniref:ribokinase n=1 Tax=Haliea sp. E1-2-M8 TaxID=3064706 RepID=UPI0027170F6E|nr:ribokinase [Haliea sp. E1-2-M8]MDO8860533.1 ribokinase [Haliea sp. E1-2-M8]